MIYYVSDMYFENLKVFDKYSRSFFRSKEKSIKKFNKKVNKNGVDYVSNGISEKDYLGSMKSHKSIKNIILCNVENRGLNILDFIKQSHVDECIKTIKQVSEKCQEFFLCRYSCLNLVEFSKGCKC